MLFAGALLLGVCVEAAATIGLQRVSRIHQRIVEEGRIARTLRHGLPSQPESVLLAGNSLLDAGVNMPVLNAGLAGHSEVRRFVVEGTAYYDWFYGLHRLFREGMRPDLIILCLSVPHLALNTSRGDFSAHFLFDRQDIWPMSRSIGADLTTTSSLYAAHYSTFYAARSELRAVLMGKISPSIPLMWQSGLPPAYAAPPANEITPVLITRLKDLDALCTRNGAQFLVLVPPIRIAGDQAVVPAGEVAHVKVLRPYPAQSLPLTDYQADGFHLNEQGALLFTNAIISELKRI